jgi:hypothetical protein
VRNPAPGPTTFRLPADLHPGRGDCQPIRVYPEQARLPAWRPGTDCVLSLPGWSVTLVEFHRTLPDWLAPAPVGPFVFADSPTGWRFTLLQPLPERSALGPPAVRERKEFALDLPAGAGRVRVVARPADGVRIAGFAERSATVRSRDHAWSATEGLLPKAGGRLAVTLPPTPWWPKSAVVDAWEIRDTVAEIGKSVGVPKPLFWPLPYRIGVLRDERPLAVDVPLRRERWRLESWAWAALLLGVPSALAAWLHRRSRPASPVRRRMWLLLVAAGWLAAYLLTPLGAGLATALAELR